MKNTRQQDRFDSLISRHRVLIEAICMRQSQYDSHLCAEYKQECFLTIWANLSTLDEEATPAHERHWVGLECRMAISHVRRKEPTYPWVSMAEVVDVPIEGEADNHAEALDELASGLTHHERQLFHLMAAGADHQEIADQMGLRKSSVAQARYRIIKKIRKQFHITPKKQKKGEK